MKPDSSCQYARLIFCMRVFFEGQEHKETRPTELRLLHMLSPSTRNRTKGWQSKAQVRQASHFHSSKKRFITHTSVLRGIRTLGNQFGHACHAFISQFLFSNLIQIFSRLIKSFVNGKAGIKPDQGRRVNAPHVRRVFLSKTIFFSPLSFYMHASVLGELRTWKTGPHWPSHARSYHIYEVVQ